jgi:hypothetical protein
MQLKQGWLLRQLDSASATVSTWPEWKRNFLRRDRMEKPKPSYAPVYAAALYPDLAPIFREHGYALAVHGSLQRDFDLIAVPWVDDPQPSDPQTVLDAITSAFAIRQITPPGTGNDKPHGRQAYTISIGHGHCSLDISFTPMSR